MPTITEKPAPTLAEYAQREIVLARESGETLDSLIAAHQDAAVRLQIEPTDGRKSVEVILPAAVLPVLAWALREMANGDTVSLPSRRKELTARQAAEILGVSRPFLTQLLDREKIPYRYVGTHRRIFLEDILQYQHRKAIQRRGLDELTEQAQELQMGY